MILRRRSGFITNFTALLLSVAVVLAAAFSALSSCDRLPDLPEIEKTADLRPQPFRQTLIHTASSTPVNPGARFDDGGLFLVRLVRTAGRINRILFVYAIAFALIFALVPFIAARRTIISRGPDFLHSRMLTYIERSDGKRHNSLS